MPRPRVFFIDGVGLKALRQRAATHRRRKSGRADLYQQ